MKSVPRHLHSKILHALSISPVVFVNGPRQAGKSTLVQEISNKELNAEYVSLDQATQMAAAASSPVEFLTSRKMPLVIDEVQLVPELFRSLKVVVDNLRSNSKNKGIGSFLLTGSANILALPKLSDALVGRMSVMTLFPFSTSEAVGGKGSALERFLERDFSHLKNRETTLTEAMRLGTYPEISGTEESTYSVWFEGYLTTLLQRDVRMLAELEKIALLPLLLRILSARAGQLLNDADIARDIGLNPVTEKFYRKILQMMFLVFDVPPWYRNLGKRLVKSSKGFLGDTLLLSHLLGYHLDHLRQTRLDLFGHVIENYVAVELMKLLSFGNVKGNLFHYRTTTGKEVDFLIECDNGSIIGIEVKHSEFVNVDDFKGLKELESLLSNDFKIGIVLYNGKDPVPFGKNLWALPYSILWQ